MAVPITDEHMPLPAKRWLLFALLPLLAALIIATILLGSVPPVDRDALTHHLFVPKLWLKHGGIYEIPEIPFSYYPMNLDLLYTIPLYFGNDIIPKYIHYSFALSTALLLYWHIRKRLGVHYGLLGALFFLSVPIIIKLSITVYVDLGVLFFTTASLLLLLHWVEQKFEWRSLVLAGLGSGLAAGTKYNGLISIAVLTLLVPIIFQQSAPKKTQSNSKALLCGVVFFAAALTTSSPWLIRNYVWTGNPIYPLHNSFFQKMRPLKVHQYPTTLESITDTPQQFTPQENNAFILRKILYNEPLWQTLLLPLRYFYEGKDDNPQFFDGKLTPFLIVLPPLAFLLKSSCKRHRNEQNMLLSFTFLYFFMTFFQGAMRIRYITPIVPPLVILSMYGLQGIFNKFSLRTDIRVARKFKSMFIIICVGGIPLWYNGQYLVNLFSTVNPFPYLQGKISRDKYIATFRPEYSAIQYANSILTQETKVLCLFLGNRGYYMNFYPVFEQPNSYGLFSEFLSLKNKKFTILDLMQERNITHVLMRNDLTALWVKQMSRENQLRIQSLFSNKIDSVLIQKEYTFFKISK